MLSPALHQMAEPESDSPSLFDQAPPGRFRSAPGGALLEVNDALVEMLGYPDKAALLGTRAQALYHNRDDRAALLAELEAAGSIHGYEVEFRRFDRRPIWVSISARVVRVDDETLQYEGVVEDLTGKRQSSAALQESMHFTRTIISSVGEGVIVYDAELHYLVWNNYMEALTGVLAEDIIGKHAVEFFPHLRKQGMEEYLQRALGGETIQTDDVLYHVPQSGNIGWYTAVFSPHISAAGEIIGVVATIHDITERKKGEAERERLLLSERDLRQQAETIGRVSQAMSAVLEMPALLDLICKESAHLFEVDSTHIWLVRKNPDGGEDFLQGIAGFGRERDKFVGMRVPLIDPVNLGARVIRDRKAICINEVDESIHTGISGIFHVRSIMGVPLFKGEQAIGALLIVDDRKVNRFSDDDLEVAMQLGNHAAIAVNNARLYDDAQSANENLKRSYVNTLEGWAKALELRDAETEGHSQRVTSMTVRLAEEMGLGDDSLEHIRRGALLHDIGKMGIPDRILGKKSDLEPDEWEIMRQHPVYAYELLSSIEYLRPALIIPFCHHERWDGTGYPLGLDGSKIPLPARIFAVVDVFDALTSDRPYRPAWTRERAIRYIVEQAGKHFDPEVVDHFLKIV